VSGTVQVNGAPLANAEVRVCPDPSSDTQSDPCRLSNPAFWATTDAKGTFVAKDVPSGIFGLAFRVVTSERVEQWVAVGRTADVRGRAPVSLAAISLRVTEIPTIR
jgi:hypothetical protein